MALEDTANSVEDHLIEGLSFKLKNGASYVQSRRSVSFFPQGGNYYSSTGVKVMKISLTGAQGEWLDPSTLVLSYVMNNANAGAQRQLRFISGPWSIFRRMRIICGGTIIEDVDNYARCSKIFIYSHQRQPVKMHQSWGSTVIHIMLYILVFQQTLLH